MPTPAPKSAAPVKNAGAPAANPPPVKTSTQSVPLVKNSVQTAAPVKTAGQPVPAIDSSAQSVPPVKNTWQPATPTGTAGRPAPPSNNLAQPVPPVKTAGQPLPPVNSSAQPLPPIKFPGQPAPPTGTAGGPVPLNNATIPSVNNTGQPRAVQNPTSVQPGNPAPALPSPWNTLPRLDRAKGKWSQIAKGTFSVPTDTDIRVRLNENPMSGSSYETASLRNVTIKNIKFLNSGKFGQFVFVWEGAASKRKVVAYNCYDGMICPELQLAQPPDDAKAVAATWQCFNMYGNKFTTAPTQFDWAIVWVKFAAPKAGRKWELYHFDISGKEAWGSQVPDPLPPAPAQPTGPLTAQVPFSEKGGNIPYELDS